MQKNSIFENNLSRWVLLIGWSVAFVLACGGCNSPATPIPVPDHFKITDDAGVPMVLIPAGTFEMGATANEGLDECKKLYKTFSHVPDQKCSQDWFANAEPVHTVTLDDFYIDQLEVTNDRYMACVDAGDCVLPKGREYTYSSKANHPVVSISWNDAVTYCEWRGGRLPTEAEWEKAARGGLDEQQYPWEGKFSDGKTNFCDMNCGYGHRNKKINDGYKATAPVGSYEPNHYGVYDMAGNVGEWVADWYDSSYYEHSSVENPQGPENGDIRVRRGGSYSDFGAFLRVSFRDFEEPYFRDSKIGFRCAKTP